MNQGFGQFCPIALASEVLTQRWMLLIIHQLADGSSRFNDIRRGVPKISATLLKQRLETLVAAEVVETRSIGDSGNSEYFLTRAGMELEEILLNIATWGQRWARDIRPEDLDPGWLIWSMHRRLNLEIMPRERTVIHFIFTDAKPKERFYWLVVNDGKVDVCVKYPGFASDVTVTTSVLTMAEIWRGIRPIRSEIGKGALSLQGKPALKKAFPEWLLLSPVANIKAARK